MRNTYLQKTQKRMAMVKDFPIYLNTVSIFHDSDEVNLPSEFLCCVHFYDSSTPAQWSTLGTLGLFLSRMAKSNQVQLVQLSASDLAEVPSFDSVAGFPAFDAVNS